MSLPPAIGEALLRGAVVLTPNQRSARLLTTEVLRETTSNLSSVAPPEILPWQAWTASLWTALTVAGVENRVVLNELQERELWQRAMAPDPPRSLATPQTIATLCAQAAHLLHSYNAAEALPRYLSQASPDAQSFARWQRSFTSICRRERLLPAALRNAALAERLRAGDAAVPLPPELIVYGFDQLLPAQSLLLDGLRARGCAIQVLPAIAGPDAHSAPVLLRTPDPQSELEGCARWARQQIDRDPATAVAIIVPDLSRCASALERALRRQLAPELRRAGDDARGLPWHMAEGVPLAEVGVAADALLLLRWCTAPLSHAEAAAVLQSRCLNLAHTAERAAEADAFLLREARGSRPELTLQQAESFCMKWYGDISGRLKRVRESAERIFVGTHTLTHWGAQVRTLLHAAGWPGEGEHDSLAFQQTERWEEVLDELSTLDLLGQPLPFSAFLERLLSRCRETRFAPENTGEPVQVMSVEEAAGSTAAAVWVLHADESTWGLEAAAHPLLPRQLQAEFAMPGTDPQRDAERARQRTQRVAATARHVTFSYAAADGDGERRPAPAVLALPGLEPRNAEPSAPPAEEQTLERLRDDEPLPALPDGVLRGGTTLLRDYAACPFRALAERRLASTTPRSRQLGLDRRDRGIALHKVLEEFWRRVKTSEELRRLTTVYEANGKSARERVLSECIDAALETPTSDDGWQPAYRNSERERLMRTLGNWLDMEMERPDFTVQDLELDVKDVRLGPLRLDLRVDRVDRVDTTEGSALVLLDYKTSSVSASKWKGERPDEPQLPAYAVAAPLEQLGAIAFASIRPAKTSLIPSPKDSLLVAPARRSASSVAEERLVFDEQVNEWRAHLTALAEGFAEGDARVDPKEFPKTCRYCEQRTLCRVDPATQLLVEEDKFDWEEDLWEL